MQWEEHQRPCTGDVGVSGNVHACKTDTVHLILSKCMHGACRPSGRVRVLVRATYLQHSAPGEDGLTDLSRMSLGPSSRPSSFSGGTGEQVPAALPLVGSSVNACASMPAHQQFRHSSVTSVPHLCVRHAGGMMCYNFLLWRKFRMKHN